MRKTVTETTMKVNLTKGVLKLPNNVLNKIVEKSKSIKTNKKGNRIILTDSYISKDYLIIPLSKFNILSLIDDHTCNCNHSESAAVVNASDYEAEKVSFPMIFYKGESCKYSELKDYKFFIYDNDLFIRHKMGNRYIPFRVKDDLSFKDVVNGEYNDIEVIKIYIIRNN